jgi:hypothetical protein
MEKWDKKRKTQKRNKEKVKLKANVSHGKSLSQPACPRE